MSLDCMLISLPIQTYKMKKMVGNYDFSPSIGLMSLYSILTFNGFQVEIIDLVNNPMKKHAFYEKLLKNPPKLLGISAYTENISLAISIAETVKKLLPDTKIAIGGAHVTLDLTEFKQCPYVDFAMVREGEGTIVELMTAIATNESLISYKDIDGLVYRKDGEVVQNAARNFITALDIIPLPCRDYFGMERFRNNRAILISTSRGCPNRCIYCSATALSGRKYRVRDIENVLLEIVMLQCELGEIPINIVDDSFTVITKRLEKFLNLIEQHGVKFSWDCESIVRHMTPELLKKMRQCGLTAIQYGIESANQAVLDGIKKGIDIVEAEKLIKQTHELGVIPIASFMFGHYCDTAETAQKTIDFMKKITLEYDAQVVASYNTPFPGTYQFEHAEELGLILNENDYRKYTLLTPIVSTKNFTLEDQVNWVYQTLPYQNRKGSLSNGTELSE